MAALLASARALCLATLAAALAALAFASPSFAAQPTGDQFQISQVGPDGDAARKADNPSAAFNPITNQALVVWLGDDSVNDKVDVFGRFVTSDGVLQGGEFRIGTSGAAGDATRDAGHPRVAYNSVRNEFLVVWHSDSETLDNDFEIRAQRVGPAGSLIGKELRVSAMGPGVAEFNAVQPQVAYNPARDNYLVVWHGIDDALPGRNEVYAHRVSGAGAAQGADIRISNLRNESTWPTIAYNSQANEFMVAFIGRDSPTDVTSQRTFVQRLTADGAVVGPNRQVFQTGHVHKAAVVYNPTHNQYLVATTGVVAGDIEAYVQRLDASGVEIGVDDARISHMGPDGAPAYGLRVDIAAGFSPATGEYLVAWHGDTTSFGLVLDEYEVFAQGLDSGGAEIGADDLPYSSMGPDGSAQYGVGNFQFTGPLAYAPDRDRFLVVWNGDNGPPAADNEVEVFGRMAATTPPVVAPPPPPVLPPPPAPFRLQLIPSFKLQFATRARGRKAVRGSLYGITGFDRLPNASLVTIRCDIGCSMKKVTFTVRTKASKGKRKKTSITLRRPVRIGKNSRVRVTVRHEGYLSRFVRYRFVRTKLGLIARRVNGGCQTPSKPVRNTPCRV